MTDTLNRQLEHELEQARRQEELTRFSLEKEKALVRALLSTLREIAKWPPGCDAARLARMAIEEAEKP